MDKKLAELIGASAREARLNLELTQEDAAEFIGVSAEFYARIERGNALPSVPTLARICSSLGVSADVLLGRVGGSEGEEADTKWQSQTPTEAPEVRRLIRRLRQASPATLRLITMLVKELDKHTT